jgi:hypothetical protein
MLYILFIIGIFVSSFCGLMPTDIQMMIPFYFRFLAFIIGAMLGFIGIVILWIRARKTGSIHLINPGRPGLINWIYIYKDDEVRITPGIRAGEGQLYNAELDAQIPDIKTYSLCDHRLRFVPEVVGHAADLDYILYANLIDSVYGFENLREARKGALNKLLKRTNEVYSQEQLIVYKGENNGSIKKKIREISNSSNATTA